MNDQDQHHALPISLSVHITIIANNILFKFDWEGNQFVISSFAILQKLLKFQRMPLEPLDGEREQEEHPQQIINHYEIPGYLIEIQWDLDRTFQEELEMYQEKIKDKVNEFDQFCQDAIKQKNQDNFKEVLKILEEEINNLQQHIEYFPIKNKDIVIEKIRIKYHQTRLILFQKQPNQKQEEEKEKGDGASNKSESCQSKSLIEKRQRMQIQSEKKFLQKKQSQQLQQPKFQKKSYEQIFRSRRQRNE